MHPLSIARCSILVALAPIRIHEFFLFSGLESYDEHMSADQPEAHQPDRSVPHPKRKYERQQPKRQIRDVDSAGQVRTFTMAIYACPGAFVGAIASWFIGIGPLPGLFLGYLIAFFVTKAIVEGSGKTASTIYAPSGKSTPVKHEYSYAESLAARGRYEEAVTAYEVAVSKFPEDPEPYLRIARMKRDKLAEFEEAVFWFKRARKDSQSSRGQELLATQEIVEIYHKKLGAPTRAIPELARIIDRFPDDPVADWAREELARLKELVAAEQKEREG